jgi:hypothetical protein
MSNEDREDVEISAIAAMTAAEVQAALRQFGLRPFERLPPSLSHLRASEASRHRAITTLVEQPKVTQSVVMVIPNRGTARKRVRAVPAWAAMRLQFQRLKDGCETFALRRVALLVGAMLFAVLLVVSSLERRATANQSKQPPVVIGVTDSIAAKIIIGDFKDGQGWFSREDGASPELLIRKSMTSLLTPRCTEAFAQAKLRSPLEVVMHEGVVILPARDLYKYPAERLGLASEATRLAYRDEFSSCRAQSGTVPSMRNGVRMTTDGRARIFLHDTAFLGESVIFKRLSLTDVLMHEFIHVGGQPATPGWFFQHDLAGFEHYDKLMSTCR